MMLHFNSEIEKKGLTSLSECATILPHSLRNEARVDVPEKGTCLRNQVIQMFISA